MEANNASGARRNPSLPKVTGDVSLSPRNLERAESGQLELRDEEDSNSGS
jgi:hypothetical protein